MMENLFYLRKHFVSIIRISNIFIMIAKRYKTCRDGYHGGIIQSINYDHLNFIHLIPIPEIGTI